MDQRETHAGQTSDSDISEISLPRRPIERLTGPLDRFLHIEAASGVVLFACAILALVVANSDYRAAYQAFWDQPARISIGAYALEYPLWYWVNDGLMTLFFFVIGLEIKHELVEGELSDRSKVVLPVVAAIGGALLPVAIFLGLQLGTSGQAGWAVPMATDIAFVVGCLALFGDRVPRGLKVFLLTLAIVDDILAVVVIAVFFAGELNIRAIAGAIAGLAVIIGLNKAGVRTVTAYVLVGTVVWLFTLKSGMHPTVAGVVLGLMTPASAWLGEESLLQVLSQASDSMGKNLRGDTLSTLQFATRETLSPLERLESALHPWVAFVIMPVFALANAGVAIDAEMLAGSLSMAIVAGLVVGKPLGIVLSSALVIRIGSSSLPTGTNWKILFASGCLAGIGFTMSLFVASLALRGDALAEAKGGVLLGSGISMLIGMGLLYLMLPRPSAAAK